MIDWRIIIIRAVLLTIVLAVSLFVWPSMIWWWLTAAGAASFGLIYPVLATGGWCVNCSGNSSETVQIDTSGFTNDSCSTCSVYNGSFVVTHNAGLSTVIFCRWTYTLPSFCTSAIGSTYDTLLLQLSDTHVLTVQFYSPAFGAVAYQWQDSLGASPDCAAWSSTVVPYLSGWAIPPGNTCVGDHSDALLTSL